MKNSKEKQELLNSIKAMEEIYNDPEVSQEYKSSIEPSLKKAKAMLAELEKAEKEEEVTVKEEKKVSKTAPIAVRKKRAAAKKKAVKKVHTVKKKANKKLTGIHSTLKRVQASLTKIKGRTKRGEEADASKKALPPGKRISASGKEYREYRENRADVQRKKVPYLEAGGTVNTAPATASHQVEVFGYRTKYLPQEVASEFIKAVAAVDAEPDKEGLYFHNTSEALKEFANMVDTIFLGLEAYNMKMVLAAALYSGAYNYKSGMHVSIDVLTLAMTKVLEDRGKSFGRGGIVGSPELRAYVNERLEAAGIDAKDFAQKIADVKFDVRNGPAGLDEDYEGFVTTKDKIDDMLQKAEIPDTLYYDLESGAVSESEPDNDEGENWYEVRTKEMLFGDLERYFKKGGRIKSAINRDRKYKSDEPWEKSYRRITRPRNPRYAAKGIQLERDKKYEDLYDAAQDFYEDLQEISKEHVDGEDREDVDSMGYWLEGAMENPDHSNLFSVIVADIEWLYKIMGKDSHVLPPVIDKVKKALQKFKWFIYDEKKERIIAAFLDTKDADKFVKDLKREEPKRIVEGYSQAHLKKMGKDPLDADSWFDKPKEQRMARGGKLEINKEYEWFVFNSDYRKIVAGNEYREDANDALLETEESYPGTWRVFSARYFAHINIDPYDIDNWANPKDFGTDKAFLGMTLINSVDNTLVANSQAGVI